MRRRTHIAVAVLVVFVLAVAGMTSWQMLRRQHHEPVYQGKGLRAWLRKARGIPHIDIGHGMFLGNPGDDAVARIGTNAIPALLEMLRRKDAPATLALIRFWEATVQRIPRLPAWVSHPAWCERASRVNNDAAKGFTILNDLALPAIPDLMIIYDENISPASRAAAAQAMTVGLKGAGMRAAIPPRAIPACLRSLASADGRAGLVAAEALDWARTDPSSVVPTLIKYLGDTNARFWVPRVLGAIGTNAQPAIPALALALKDPTESLRVDAATALRQIDPEAATQAGAIPALIQALSSTDFTIRAAAASGLEAYGAEASPAIPALNALLVELPQNLPSAAQSPGIPRGRSREQHDMAISAASRALYKIQAATNTGAP